MFDKLHQLKVELAKLVEREFGKLKPQVRSTVAELDEGYLTVKLEQEPLIVARKFCVITVRSQEDELKLFRAIHSYVKSTKPLFLKCAVLYKDEPELYSKLGALMREKPSAPLVLSIKALM